MTGLSRGPELSAPPLPPSSGAEPTTMMLEHHGDEEEVKARDPSLQQSPLFQTTPTQTTKWKKKKKQQSDSSRPDDDGSASATTAAPPAPVQQGHAPDVPVSSSFAHRRVPRMLACLFSRGQSLVKTETVVPVRKSPRLWGSTDTGDNKSKRRVTFAAASSVAAGATATATASTHLVIHKPQQTQKQPHGPQRRSKRDKKRGAIALVDEATTAGGDDTCAVVADTSSRKSRKSGPHDSPAVPRKADDDRFPFAHRGVTPSPASIGGGEGGTDDEQVDDHGDHDGGNGQGSPTMGGIKLLTSEPERSDPTGQDSESGAGGSQSGAAKTNEVAGVSATVASSRICRPKAVHYDSPSCEPTRKQAENSVQSTTDGAEAEAEVAAEVATGTTTSAAAAPTPDSSNVRDSRHLHDAAASNPNANANATNLPAEVPSAPTAPEEGGRPDGLEPGSSSNGTGQNRIATTHEGPNAQRGRGLVNVMPPLNSKLSPAVQVQLHRHVEPPAPKGGFDFDELCEPTGYVSPQLRMPPIRDDFAIGAMLLGDACIAIDMPEFRDDDVLPQVAANVVDDPAVHWKYGAARNRYKELPPMLLLPHHHPFYCHTHHPHEQHEK